MHQKNFKEENIPNLPENSDIEKEFSLFWDTEKQKEVQRISSSEHIDSEIFENIISEYLYTHKTPRREKIMSLNTQKIPLKKRTSIFENLKNIIIDFVEKFEI